MMQSVSLQGELHKLKSVLAADGTVQYSLPIGKESLGLNIYLGQKISLEFSGSIHCIHCGKLTKKSYSQGYCFPCSQKLARCDFCIVKPEKCHFHLGTCREPEWGKTYCFIPHIVYIANTSGIKVGITRETQIPTRWIDQGALQALPIFRLQNRYESGLVEVALKQHFNDRTDWRKMLQGEGEVLELQLERERIVKDLMPAIPNIEIHEKCDVQHIKFPVLEYPKKVQSLNIEKTPNIEGTLLGIKGQYLLLDIGVINIRNLTGYQITIQAGGKSLSI